MGIFPCSYRLKFFSENTCTAFFRHTKARSTDKVTTPVNIATHQIFTLVRRQQPSTPLIKSYRRKFQDVIEEDRGTLKQGVEAALPVARRVYI